jgi:hypothetical protein
VLKKLYNIRHPILNCIEGATFLSPDSGMPLSNMFLSPAGLYATDGFDTPTASKMLRCFVA